MSRDSADQIEIRASEWLARRDANEGSPQEQASFDAWINESAAHRIAYWRLENAWDEALRLKALGAGIQSDRPPPLGDWNLSPFFSPSEAGQSADLNASPASAGLAPQRQQRRGLRAALAAGFVLATLAAGGYLWPTGKNYETSVGGMASVPIADGSKVLLNTDSEIKVAISDKERRVDLKHGEAFFDVAKDPGRPFIVTVGDKRIVVIGTKFSVRRDVERDGDTARASDVQIVVTEGAVRVESESGRGVESIAPRRLHAGNVARANRGGLMVQQTALPKRKSGWPGAVAVWYFATFPWPTPWRSSIAITSARL